MYFNMKKKYLFSFALLLAGATAANAQVIMSEDFSAEQTKSPTDVGYYEFINTQEGDEREVKDGALHFYNTDAFVCANQTWQRAIKFRNLPIEENTSYRVTLKLMGSNTYYSLDDDAEVRTNARFALMQGGENLDMGFLAANGEQQFSDISRFQTPDEGKGYFTYTGMFYYTNDAAQKAWYAEQNPTKDELPATYFLTLNVYNPGDFYIDDIIVEKAAIQGVQFYNDVIKVNFGYAISTANLNGADRLLLPNDCVTVKLNGKQVNIMTVELRKDGNFYIFLDDEYPGDGTYDEKNTKVEVSFTNPTDAAYQLQYANGKTPGGAVMNFTDEVAVYNEGQEDVYSFAFETPSLVSTDPENGSFNLPVDMKEFKFTFNKPVDCTLVEARLDNEKLSVSPAEGVASELTFIRNGADLAAGEYTLTVTKIFPEAMLYDDVFGTEKLTLTFGKVNVDPNDTVRVVMKDDFAEVGANGYPTKWMVMSDNNLRQSPDDNWASGSRLMGGFTGGEFTVGMYLCSRSGSEGYAFYGAKEAEEDKFHLTPGKYQFSMRCATWDTDDTNYARVEICDDQDKVLASTFQGVSPRLDNGRKDASQVSKVELNFRVVTEGNYVIKIYCLKENGQPGGWGDGILFGNVKVKYLPAAAGVEETNILLTALAEAKAALENNSDERYLGADYDALEAAIKAYDGKETVFTAPSQFRNAAAELNAAVDALKAHRSLCDTYDPLVDNAKAARDMRTGTKFERHEGYAAIEAAIAKYEGKVLTDNAELQAAITELQNTTGLMQNIGRVVETYLSSMVSGLATLEMLGASDEALTAEVNDLLTDDATVKAKVKNALWQAINIQLGTPDNNVFAVKQDPDTFEEFRDSLNLSVFIDNPELYYTSWDDKAPASVTSKPLPATENLPGWELNNVQKGWDIAYHYPWGANAQYAYNEVTCPAADGMISAWTSSFDLEQTIQNLPVGKYTLTVGMSERVQDEVASYAFAKTTETELQAAPANLGGGTEPGPNAIVIPGIEVNDGVLTIGAHVANTDHPFINSFHLYMVNAKEGYDYAAGIADVNNAATVRRVEWFDLNGRRVNNAARGVVIQKQTMSDGTVRANKVVK